MVAGGMIAMALVVSASGLEVGAKAEDPRGPNQHPPTAKSSVAEEKKM